MLFFIYIHYFCYFIVPWKYSGDRQLLEELHALLNQSEISRGFYNGLIEQLIN